MSTQKRSGPKGVLPRTQRCSGSGDRVLQVPRVSASHRRAHKGCLFRPQGCWLPPPGSHQTDRWHPSGSQALGSLRQVFPFPTDPLLQNPGK